MGGNDQPRVDSFYQRILRQGDYQGDLHGYRTDGMLQGPAIDLYKEIRDEIPFLYIIASGGVSSIEDIEKLSEAGIPAVIFGKAIYEGKIQLKDLTSFYLK